jgi:carbonic anhydrase
VCLNRIYGKLKLLFIVGAIALPGMGALADMKPSQSSDEALKILEDGNHRYVLSQFLHPHQLAERRAEVAKEQHPFAVILTCADSRVPPEVIFDEGLGDLFVIRVAGNIVDDAVLGSIEYAVAHLGTPLVVVMGHERCGAVDAAVHRGEIEGHIGTLVQAIQPAVVKVQNKPGDLLENSIKTNVAMVTAGLAHNKPVLEHLVDEGKLKIVGAYYDLDDGSVEFLD